MRFMQIESVLQTINRSEPAKNRFSVALVTAMHEVHFPFVLYSVYERTSMLKAQILPKTFHGLRSNFHMMRRDSLLVYIDSQICKLTIRMHFDQFNAVQKEKVHFFTTHPIFSIASSRKILKSQ